MLAAWALLFSLSLVAATPKPSYECGGCVVLIGELERKIAAVDPSKTIDVGSFRVSPDGEQKGIKKVSFARSQTHIEGILDGACDEAKDYKLVVHPKTGKAVFARKEATYLKGDDNKTILSKLQNACNDMVDAHEDAIPKFLAKASDDSIRQFCMEKLGACSSVDMTPLPPDEPAVEENDEL